MAVAPAKRTEVGRIIEQSGRLALMNSQRWGITWLVAVAGLALRSGNTSPSPLSTGGGVSLGESHWGRISGLIRLKNPPFLKIAASALKSRQKFLSQLTYKRFLLSVRGLLVVFLTVSF